MAETNISLPAIAGSNRSESVRIANSGDPARQRSRAVEERRATAKSVVLRTVAVDGRRVGAGRMPNMAGIATT
jgi:hypothetical protein